MYSSGIIEGEEIEDIEEEGEKEEKNEPFKTLVDLETNEKVKE